MQGFTHIRVDLHSLLIDGLLGDLHLDCSIRFPFGSLGRGCTKGCA